MTEKKVKFLLAVFVVLILNVGVRAQSSVTPPKQADGVDFILLIDESGSMCGSRVHKGQNDPGNKRNEFISLILPDILNSSTKGRSYRVSVIEFGSRYGSSAQWQAQVTLSAYEIPKRRPAENDEAYRRRVEGDLSFLSKPRSRGDSDHGQAVELAQEEIEKLNRTLVPVPVGYSGVEGRLKVIFMLTDGKPYVQKQTGQVVSDVELKREIEQVIGNLKQGEAILYVFGLNADDDYWFGQGYEAFWRNVAGATSDNQGQKGDAQFITNHERIYAQIAKILHRYTDAPPLSNLKIIEGKKYDCPPYLKSIEFKIEFSRNYMRLEDTLEIKDPNGKAVPYTYFQVHKTFALLKVEGPLRGTWTFDRKKKIEIMVNEEPQTAEYVLPVSPIPFGSSEKVVFKIPGKTPGTPFVLLPAFPLEGQITAADPVKAEQVLNAEADTQTPGNFVSTVPYRFDRQGVYKFRFSGSVITGTGEKQEVIASALHEVTVINTKPVKVLLETPSSLSSCFGTYRENVILSFYVQQQAIAVEEILKAKPGIEAELTIRRSSIKIKPAQVIPLKYEDGRLVGEVAGGIQVRYYPELFFGKLRGKLTLKMDNRILKQDYFLEDPRTLSHLYEFEIPVEEPFWLYLLLILVLLAFMALIAYFLFFKGKAEALSRDIPLLVYRHGDKFNPDHTVQKVIEVFKRKMTFNKKVRTPFDIPGLSDQWTPELTITRMGVPLGVKIKVRYERFMTNKEDKNRFEEIVMETRDNNMPYQHRIMGLEEHDMMFELKIKEDQTKTENK